MIIAGMTAPTSLRLTDWGVIRAQGADAAHFLHGQLTQDFALLDRDHARLAGFCTAKGRLLATLVGWRAGDDEILLALPADTLAATLKRLSMFVLRAKCKLSDASAEFAVHGLLGQPATAAWTLVRDGDTVQVAMDAVDDGWGETRLSREKAKRAETWQLLENVHTSQEVIKGTISGRVKGGFTVEIHDIRAFLPGSLVDVRPQRDADHLEGKELEFKVIKLDPKRNNVVVSRRAVLEEENSAEREALLKNLQEGQQIKGIVKNLTDYGAFVDLGGVDGLLHITDTVSYTHLTLPTKRIV